MPHEKMLLQRLSRGDHSAFYKIYQSHYQSVLRLIRWHMMENSNVGSELGQEVRDVTQEVFIKLWTERHLFKNVKNMQGYLVMTGRRIASRRLVLAKLRCVREAKHFDLFAESNSFEFTNQVVYNDLELLTRRVIEQELSEAQRKVFILIIFHNLSLKEAGEVLNMDIHNVKQNLYRAKARLKPIVASFCKN